jgi:hypothetical protein
MTGVSNQATIATHGMSDRGTTSGGTHPARVSGTSGRGRAGDPGPSPAVWPTPTHTPPVQGGRACRAGDVVLSLFNSQQKYGLGQAPAFDVDVVSTSARTCSFNVGAKFLALEIKSGAVRVWSSADCGAGPGSLIIQLVRGVPAVLPMSWDRVTSTARCRAAPAPARYGRYLAVATDGRLVSNTQAFRLGAYR